MSNLFVSPIKNISTSDVATTTKTFTNKFIGKDEIIYRIHFLQGILNIDPYEKKTTSKKASGAEIYDGKLNVFCNTNSFSAIENSPIKDFKHYLLFAMYLAINYTRDNSIVKAYVDNHCKNLQTKYEFIDSKFAALEPEIKNKEIYSYFKSINDTCYDAFMKIYRCYALEQHSSLPSTISQEVQDKCTKVAFKDTLIGYTYDTKPAYGFTSPHQIASLLLCNDEETTNTISNIYNAVLKSLVSKTAASKAAGSTSNRSSKSTSSKNKKIEAEDDDIVDDDEDNELEL